MPAGNPLREALTAGKFCYVVELVASRLTREARLLEVASQLAQVPGVVAGSITSYAGGAMGRDPIRVGTAARARGLVPNIHLTCVNRDVPAARRALEDLNALGIENVLALSGDYPKSAANEAEDFAAAANFRSRFRPTRRANRRNARQRPAILDFRSRFALQIHRSRLRLSISKARKENRRRRRLRHHPTRLRRKKIPRAKALSR